MGLHSIQNTNSLTLVALDGFPLVSPGDDISALILQSVKNSNLRLESGDILVIAQKIISKSEERFVRLSEINPSKSATELAELTGKDPSLIELILSESHKIIRYRPGVIVAENKNGVVLANAGIDHSNVGGESRKGQVLLLPKNPDKSAKAIREELQKLTKVKIAVIINDSIGRAWRNGTIGTALGISGMPAILDLRGQSDLFGNPLIVSEQAIADEISSAASLLQGQTDGRRPVVLIRGYEIDTLKNSNNSSIGVSTLIRPKEKDMFR
tara:strand:- start:454 stop:1260 length:807 start_codon:yes stop_codon:yes gene_type:complete